MIKTWDTVDRLAGTAALAKRINRNPDIDRVCMGASAWADYFSSKLSAIKFISSAHAEPKETHNICSVSWSVLLPESGVEVAVGDEVVDRFLWGGQAP